MKIQFTRLLPLLLLTSSLANAGVVVSFLPAGPNLTGAAGQTVQWNFQITNSTSLWLLIDQVDYLTSSPVGTFHDLVTSGAPTFNPSDVVPGLSTYSISNLAPPNFHSTGTLTVTFDEFTVSPDSPTFNPDTDTFALGQTAAAAATVATAGAPEPSTALLILGAAAGLLLRRARNAGRRV